MAEVKKQAAQQQPHREETELFHFFIKPQPRERTVEQSERPQGAVNRMLNFLSGRSDKSDELPPKEERGEWITLPITDEELQKVFARLGIDPKEQNFVISDYKCSIEGLALGKILTEKEDLSELNYLAAKLGELTPAQQPLYAAAAQLGDHAKSAKDLINLTENLSCYDMEDKVTTPTQLGVLRYGEQNPALKPHIDFASLGRETAEKEQGIFTPAGYIRANENPFVEFYNGMKEQIPEQYRLALEPLQQEAAKEQPQQAAHEENVQQNQPDETTKQTFMRSDPQQAFENAIAKGLSNPEDYMYMYSETPKRDAAAAVRISPDNRDVYKENLARAREKVAEQEAARSEQPAKEQSLDAHER